MQAKSETHTPAYVPVIGVTLIECEASIPAELHELALECELSEGMP